MGCSFGTGTYLRKGGLGHGKRGKGRSTTGEKGTRRIVTLDSAGKANEHCSIAVVGVLPIARHKKTHKPPDPFRLNLRFLIFSLS